MRTVVADLKGKSVRLAYRQCVQKVWLPPAGAFSQCAASSFPSKKMRPTGIEPMTNVYKAIDQTRVQSAQRVQSA